MISHSKLHFDEYLNSMLSKVHKTIVMLQKIQNILPCHSTLTICETLLRSQLDYDDAVYDQVFNESCLLESFLCNVVWAITYAIRVTNAYKLYQELYSNQIKFQLNHILTYFHSLISTNVVSSYSLHTDKEIPLLRVKHLFFNLLMHNVPKWSDTLLKCYSKCCIIFKVCLTNLEHYALKG